MTQLRGDCNDMGWCWDVLLCVSLHVILGVFKESNCQLTIFAIFTEFVLRKGGQRENPFSHILSINQMPSSQWRWAEIDLQYSLSIYSFFKIMVYLKMSSRLLSVFMIMVYLKLSSRLWSISNCLQDYVYLYLKLFLGLWSVLKIMVYHKLS